MKNPKTIGRNLVQLSQKAKTLRKNLQKKFEAKPLVFFYSALLALVLLIILGNIIRKPASEAKETAKVPQTVEIYALGSSPRVTVTGDIEKSGVVKIVALTSGVVSQINFREGAQVAKGATLMRLASNYHGGNAMSAQRQLAAVQYQQALDTYQFQKDIIAKQKESAEKMDAQSSELR